MHFVLTGLRFYNDFVVQFPKNKPVSGSSMSLKLELASLAIITFGASGFMLVAEPLDAPAPLERTAVFSDQDYQAFDHKFTLGNKSCEVGIKRHRLCFNASPLETVLVPGEPLPANVPVLSAEFPILVETPVKAEHQKLVRYGTTLALIHQETQIVEDVLYLGTDESA